jgi:hypothetical protein
VGYGNPATKYSAPIFSSKAGLFLLEPVAEFKAVFLNEFKDFGHGLNGEVIETDFPHVNTAFHYNAVGADGSYNYRLSPSVTKNNGFVIDVSEREI